MLIFHSKKFPSLNLPSRLPSFMENKCYFNHTLTEEVRKRVTGKWFTDVSRPPATLSMLLSVFEGTLAFTMLGLLSSCSLSSWDPSLDITLLRSTRCKMFREKGNAPPWSRLCCLLHTELCSFDGRIQWCNSSLNILHPSFPLTFLNRS
jgi:hypothetical protein